MKDKQLLAHATRWFSTQGWRSFPFQRDTWQAYLDGKNGMLTAPTGSGKTYALLLPIMLDFMRRYPKDYGERSRNGLQALWISPIRALTKEIEASAQRAIDGLGLQWTVGIRTGDTKNSARARQKKNMPELLITTPESLHLLLAQKDSPSVFKELRCVICDEWHELMGSKRAVAMELALSRLKGMNSELRIWGISATIGNMQEATDVLLGPGHDPKRFAAIRAAMTKHIRVRSVMPKTIEKFPWAGHLGLQQVHDVLPILRKSRSTLIFCNTRSFAELWFQKLLDVAPDLAGIIALHHGSLSRDIRDWVENALHEEKLKVVVCTSSLDLGVDFRPVETVIQVGGPKNIARFMQRAGRSGHQPRALSKIHFVPTHSLELAEAAALRTAIETQRIEERTPYIRSFDVLAQFLVTLAVGPGFRQEEVRQEVQRTFSYSSINDQEWNWILGYITTGSDTLLAYDEFKKVEVEEGIYKVNSRRVAMHHRMSIGTITSDAVMQVKTVGGSYIGTVEEWFISKLKPGDVFWFAGRSLELVRVNNMKVQVRKAKKRTGRIPNWQGGRMPLSSQMSEVLRQTIQKGGNGSVETPELKKLQPLFAKQNLVSHVPTDDEFLIEKVHSREGCHVFMYPFEGRLVHEGIAALLAYRISLLRPITMSIAMNDYGFELLSDSDIPIEDAIDSDLHSTKHLVDDIIKSVNATEMAGRKFREIAQIAGLIFKGLPGKQKKTRHLQASSHLFFEVFKDNDPDNLLLKQAYDEVFTFQLEEVRLRRALDRMSRQKIVFTYPKKFTPFSFPIMVDRMRERVSSEKLKDRIARMKVQLEKA